MPDDPLYIAIDDAIAQVIGKFGVTLNRLVQLELTTDRDLTGFERTELQDLTDARRADIEAGRPDDGVLRHARTLNLVNAGVPKTDARRIAAREEADLVRDEEKRLRARPSGWVRPPPPKPRLQRDLVEMALGEIIDNLWQQGQIDIMHMEADRSAMPPVPRVTSLQLRRVLLTGEWIIASRDCAHDPLAHVGLHITEAGLKVLLDAIETKLTPPAWLKRPTLDELENVRTSYKIAPEVWPVICHLYEERCWFRLTPPMLGRRDNYDKPDNDYDFSWGRRMGIKQRKIKALRLAYLGKRRKAQP
jgi:hypothetical protein